MCKPVAALCALVLVAVVGGCGAGDATPSGEGTPSESGRITALVFAYGVGAKNVLDTLDGTFTKDMIVELPLTVGLTLTDEELARIAVKMDEIGFMAYPEAFAPRGGGGAMTPYMSYRFTVTIGTTTKSVTWDDEFGAEDPFAVRLRELARLIRQAVEAKPEYRRVPEPRGGYM